MRQRGQTSRMLGMEGRRHRLWWSGNGDEVGGVEVKEKEELCWVVEGRRVSDRVMAVVLIFEEDVLRLICEHAIQSCVGVSKEIHGG